MPDVDAEIAALRRIAQFHNEVPSESEDEIKDVLFYSWLPHIDLNGNYYVESSYVVVLAEKYAPIEHQHRLVYGYAAATWLIYAGSQQYRLQIPNAVKQRTILVNLA